MSQALGAAIIKPSVVVRSKDEAPRLRLTLASLSRQTAPVAVVAVVAVDDGSSDDTQDAPVEAPVTIIRHPTSRGRSVSSNAGQEWPAARRSCSSTAGSTP